MVSLFDEVELLAQSLEQKIITENAFHTGSNVFSGVGKVQKKNRTLKSPVKFHTCEEWFRMK